MDHSHADRFAFAEDATAPSGGLESYGKKEGSDAATTRRHGKEAEEIIFLNPHPCLLFPCPLKRRYLKGTLVCVSLTTGEWLSLVQNSIA